MSENNRLRALCVSDIHADQGLVRKMAEQAKKEKVDCIVLAGDITHFDQETENIVGPLAELGIPVMLIHGNHEPPTTAEFLSELYEVTHLNGKGLEIKGAGIFGAGGADLGPHPTIDTEIYHNLKEGHSQIKHLSKKLMVVHEHPRDTSIEFNGMFPGNKAIRNAIRSFKPDVVVCGHIHDTGGIEDRIGKTRIVNVAKTPTVIDL